MLARQPLFRLVVHKWFGGAVRLKMESWYSGYLIYHSKVNSRYCQGSEGKKAVTCWWYGKVGKIEVQLGEGRTLILKRHAGSALPWASDLHWWSNGAMTAGSLKGPVGALTARGFLQIVNWGPGTRNLRRHTFNLEEPKRVILPSHLTHHRITFMDLSRTYGRYGVKRCITCKGTWCGNHSTRYCK